MPNECLICFYPVQRKESLATCKTCKKICHKTCYKCWTSKHPKQANECVHCRQKQCIVYYKRPSLISIFCKYIYNLCEKN